MIIKTLYLVIQFLLMVYVLSSVAYFLFFAIANLFPYRINRKPLKKNPRIAVLIPGYKEDRVIVDVAEKALEQSYPKELYDVIIIADSFQEQTLKKLRELPVIVIEVKFENSTKAKALNKALEILPEEYDWALVLDADNVMEYDFLKKLSQNFDEKQFIALQTHRTAKNTNTPLAHLDAISEEINNSLFRKGHRVLGFSAALIGSGMLFPYRFFKNIMKNIKAVGGFDKELELNLLKEGYKIDYLDDAYVLDEKVAEHANFSNQRRRWLAAQFYYFKKFFPDAVRSLFHHGQTDYFDKAWQMILPPRALLIGFMPLLCLSFGLLNPLFGLQTLTFFWLAGLLAFLLSLFLAIPKKFYNKNTLYALLELPKSIWLMFSNLFKLKGSNKKFIHTTHGGI